MRSSVAPTLNEFLRRRFNMGQSRKTFHFTLDEIRPKALYPSDAPTGYKRALAKIRSFLEPNGFEHTQYSGYESTSGMSYYQAYSILKNLQNEFQWFQECAKAATLTGIGRHHGVLQHFARSMDIKESGHVRQERGGPVTLRGEAENMRKAAQALSVDTLLESPTKTRQDDGR